MSLSIVDIADYELLMAVEVNSGKRTSQLATILDVDNRSTASRLSWMRRMGLVEQTIAENWLLTKKGEAVIHRSKGDLMVIRKLSQRAAKDPSMGWVTKREFRRNL